MKWSLEAVCRSTQADKHTDASKSSSVITQFRSIAKSIYQDLEASYTQKHRLLVSWHYKKVNHCFSGPDGSRSVSPNGLWVGNFIGSVGAVCLLQWSRAQSLKSPCFDMETWWEAGGQRLRLCLCGLLSGLMGNRCGKAGGWAASQSSWEKLKTTAFLETGGITVREREAGRERRREGGWNGRSSRHRESFKALRSLSLFRVPDIE